MTSRLSRTCLCSNISQFVDKYEFLFVAENGEGKAGEACPEGNFWRLTFGFLAINLGNVNENLLPVCQRGIHKVNVYLCSNVSVVLQLAHTKFCMVL